MSSIILDEHQVDGINFILKEKKAGLFFGTGT
jgi:hypothetical protein